jgi:predicted TIM-barrel fold metal-dependent hydrolase
LIKKIDAVDSHLILMKLIAIEEHFLTPQIQAAWKNSSLGTEGTDAFDERKEIAERLRDLGEGRIALMDEAGVDVQVLSVTTPALHNLEAEESVDLARQTNDFLAGVIAKNPTRFQGFATLPMPAPEMAAVELERCVREHGFKGAMLCGRTRDMNLDAPAFLPIFETTAQLGVPLYIHPQIPQQPVREALYGGFGESVSTAFAAFGLGWHYEAGIQFVRLILAGVFDRFPELQIILGHWGEVVLFYTERLQGLARVAPLGRPVLDYFCKNLFVTPSGMWSRAYMQRALEVVGPERILFSADFPYQYRPGRQARTFLTESGLSLPDQELFAHGNWERLTESLSSRKRFCTTEIES